MKLSKFTLLIKWIVIQVKSYIITRIYLEKESENIITNKKIFFFKLNLLILKISFHMKSFQLLMVQNDLTKNILNGGEYLFWIWFCFIFHIYYIYKYICQNTFFDWLVFWFTNKTTHVWFFIIITYMYNKIWIYKHEYTNTKPKYILCTLFRWQSSGYLPPSERRYHTRQQWNMIHRFWWTNKAFLAGSNITK